MRRLIIAIMVLVASTSYAQAPRSWPTYMDENGDMKNVSASSPMPVDADVSIGSVSVDVFPVFADSTGNPATATIDANNRAVVNIGSETIGLVNAVKQCTEWDEQYVALTANTAATFTTEIAGSRRFVELTSQNQEIEFWVSLGGTAVIGQCRPVNGSIYIEVPKDVIISMIASQAVSISIIEGGY